MSVLLFLFIFLYVSCFVVPLACVDGLLCTFAHQRVCVTLCFASADVRFHILFMFMCVCVFVCVGVYFLCRFCVRDAVGVFLSLFVLCSVQYCVCVCLLWFVRVSLFGVFVCCVFLCLPVLNMFVFMCVGLCFVMSMCICLFWCAPIVLL